MHGRLRRDATTSYQYKFATDCSCAKRITYRPLGAYAIGHLTPPCCGTVPTRYVVLLWVLALTLRLHYQTLETNHSHSAIQENSNQLKLGSLWTSWLRNMASPSCRSSHYYCELNAIELVWTQVNGYVARNNETFKLNNIIKLFEEYLKEVTLQRWSD
ncbi:hypothetical protein EVAR_94314_1 [Eumeta japonica]|uniref:Uncharacterized protein n=1 Tax=Eumeta variegata TaxID=151549 RepID=A0A4C1UFA4_EUMVA|nr:hypothetical protein EVAR_94314_1 [Eumeta japonica]